MGTPGEVAGHQAGPECWSCLLGGDNGKAQLRQGGWQTQSVAQGLGARRCSVNGVIAVTVSSYTFSCSSPTTFTQAFDADAAELSGILYICPDCTFSPHFSACSFIHSMTCLKQLLHARPHTRLRFAGSVGVPPTSFLIPQFGVFITGTLGRGRRLGVG